MNIKKVFCTVEIGLDDGLTISFSKRHGSDIDAIALVNEGEPSPIDIFNEDEIRNAQEYAAEEFTRRGI